MLPRPPPAGGEGALTHHCVAEPARRPHEEMALSPQRLSTATSLPTRPGAPRARSAGHAVFDALYDALFPNVYAHAARHAQDVAEAEALTTAAWEAIVLALPHRDPNANLGEWLFRIVRREVASRARTAEGAR